MARGPMMGVWHEYLLWNKAVADAVYPELRVPRMVFLDLEGDALGRLAAALELDGDAVVPVLQTVCRAVLDVSVVTKVFRPIERATEAWRRGARSEPPPAVAMLALFSLAAERMERDADVSASNYYAQLERLLDTSETSLDLGQSYRAGADSLWDSLVEWLDVIGSRGTPVRFTVGKNHFVGRAKAQALVRDTDRRRFTEFFQHFDLAPGTILEPVEMEALLESWIAVSRSVSSHIRGLWEQPDVRPHLAEAVLALLSTWDGHLTDRHEAGVTGSRVRLTVARRRGLRRGVDLGLLLNLPQADQARSANLRVASGSVPVTLVPESVGAMRVRELKRLVEAASLVDGVITIEDECAKSVHRLPADVVVLRRDPFSAESVEVSQVRLGDAVSILARADRSLDGVLVDVSGTDWDVFGAAELPGLPEGWLLYENVTIAGRPSQDLGAFDALRALVPLTQTAFEFSGGLRVPGLRQVFHTDAAPVVTMSAAGEGFSCTLFDLTPETPEELDGWSSDDGGAMTLDLADLELEAGEYGLWLKPCAGEAREKKFTLADSGESPFDGEYEEITHDVREPLGVLCADAAETTGMLVQGVPLFVDGGAGIDRTVATVPTAPWWRRVREQIASLQRMPTPEPDSCVRTGQHVEEVEPARRDERGYAMGTSLGICQGCGRVKRYYNSYWRNHRRWRRAREGGAVASAPSRRSTSGRTRNLGTSVDWTTALDLLIALGGGNDRTLRGITAQLDPSARFFHEFVATMETLGHIEVQRDPRTVELRSWETSPTLVVDRGERRELIGHWTKPLLRQLRGAGVSVELEEQTDGPARRLVCASAERMIAAVPEATLVFEPALLLVRNLPPLSAVMAALPQIDVPEALTFERYVPAHDAWVRASTARDAGSYRTGGFERRYFVVNATDVGSGQARPANATLAKHAAALLDGARPLMAYSPGDEQLVVPLGAALPGMYGRAASLASGRTRERRDVLGIGSYEVYREVPADLAHSLHHLLGS